MELPAELVALLRTPCQCFVATTMADGSPQMTLTWADTDGAHILVNTVVSSLKTRNVRRDPRVAVTVADPASPAAYHAVRGRVSDITTDGAAEHIEALSQRYLGRPYPWYEGRERERVILVIEADRIRGVG